MRIDSINAGRRKQRKYSIFLYCSGGMLFAWDRGMTKTEPSQTPVAPPPVPRQGLFARFAVLAGAVRELWVVFGTKLLTILAYAVMNSTLVLWLSWDLGYKDVGAGNVVMAWSCLLTFCTVLVGSLVDAIGLRKALLLGVGICLWSRAVLTFAGYKWLALLGGLMPLALGEALLTPVMVAAVRRYTTTAQRSIGFSIFYVMMNVGFLIGGLVFDGVRHALGEHGQWTLPGVGLELSTYRVLFLLSFLLTIPNLVLIYFLLREGVEVTDTGVKIAPERVGYPGKSIAAAFGLTVRAALRDTARIFAGLWGQPAFFKFLAFLSLVVAVRLVFYHMHYTYPKFGIRELGEGAPVMHLWVVNPALIIVLVPLVGACTQRVAAYKMVTVGSMVSAASVFIMALPPVWFEPLANGWLGNLLGHWWLGVKGPIHPYYLMIFLYVVVLSVGEALWSPRLYKYTAAVAPRGQEASYMAMSMLPFFVAKLLVGTLSGLLLSWFCPENGPRHSEVLWLVIALMTLITPVGLVLLRPFIRVHEAGRADD
jgi:MFS family permease